jgi:integrase
MGRSNTGSIWFDHQGVCKERYHRRCAGRWKGQVSLGIDPETGRRLRPTVSGESKEAVQAKIDKLRADRVKGIKPRAGYTVGQAIDDYLDQALDGRAPKTVSTYREVLVPVREILGSTKLTDLNSDQVRTTLVRVGQTRSAKTGSGRSSRYVQLSHQQLTRVIRYAESRDLVGRNVARLIDTPHGSAPGRPSKSLTVLQARKLIYAARKHPLRAYIMLSLMTGMRPEEVRALRWGEVDLDEPSVAVYSSERHGGDTKTARSRRRLMIPDEAAQALDEHADLTEASLNSDELVFNSAAGTPLDPSHVRRAFKLICKQAGIGEDWTPRELRHSFVSIMSASGANIERIAQLAGHSSSQITQVTYRHGIEQAALEGAEILGPLLSRRPPRQVRHFKRGTA